MNNLSEWFDMEDYDLEEIDISAWKSQKYDKFLLSMTKISENTWKGELYKSYGLYYKALIKDNKVQDILNLGWELQQK